MIWMLLCRHDLFRIDTANVKDDSKMGLKRKLQKKGEKSKPKYIKLYIIIYIYILYFLKVYLNNNNSVRFWLLYQ